jgi:hypothetical protein
LRRNYSGVIVQISGVGVKLTGGFMTQALHWDAGALASFGNDFTLHTAVLDCRERMAFHEAGEGARRSR